MNSTKIKEIKEKITKAIQVQEARLNNIKQEKDQSSYVKELITRIEVCKDTLIAVNEALEDNSTYLNILGKEVY